MMPSRRNVLGAISALGLALSAAACSSTPAPKLNTIPATTIPPVVSSTTVVIDGKIVTVPREEYHPQIPISPENDNGQQIIITNKGVLPQNLNAPVPAHLTWTNLTNSPVTVTFAAVGGGSPPIPPGGSWSFTEIHSVSIGYSTSNGYHGQVGVGLMPEPPLPTTTTSPAS